MSKFGEFELIDLIRKANKIKDKRVLVGIGDDCAVIAEDAKKLMLATTDMLVENEHFTLKFDPFLIGEKSMTINVSDIAAMGGVPKYALVSVGLKGSESLDFVKKLYAGMKSACRKYGFELVGGDTVHSNRVIVSVTLLGEVEKGNYILRSGAKVDDYVLVTGCLGAGAANLLAGKIYIPKIHVKLARELAKRKLVNAMIDISDGLSSEINHIAKESGTGAEIYEECIPVSKEVLRIAKRYGKDPVKLALNGGEDYELLFTVEPDKLFDAVALSKEYSDTRVLGRIVPKKQKVTIMKKGKKRFLPAGGYDHFN